MLEESSTTEEKQAIAELKEKVHHILNPRQLKDETFYYRFLKARNFNMKEAEKLIHKHLSDYELYNITDFEHYTTPKNMDKYFPLSFIGYDKTGSVVRYADVGQADIKGIINLFSFKDIVRYCIIPNLERDTELMAEESKKRGKPVYQFVFILNMEHLNFFQATYKKGLDALYDGFKIFQDNFPERVKAVYIINASHYFPIAYSVVKSVLASEVIKKIHIFGKTDWQEILLENIDANVLPAFLGGNRTDPDGNPLCNTYVKHGEKVPEDLLPSNRKKLLSQENGVKKLTVTRFSYSEIPFYVYEPETCIEWEFETKARDIAFGLNYVDNSAIDAKFVEVIPKQRVDTLMTAETGFYKCDKAGTYMIVFDNSYSWMFSKEIYYKIRLVKPT